VDAVDAVDVCKDLAEAFRATADGLLHAGEESGHGEYLKKCCAGETDADGEVNGWTLMCLQHAYMCL